MTNAQKGYIGAAVDNTAKAATICAMKWYPLRFVPIFKHRIWGGRRLKTILGKDLPPGEKIGESWELVDLPHDESIVANGPLAGRPLSSVVQEYPIEILGQLGLPQAFPLLVKFLDAQDALSVQVHPDAGACRRLGKGKLKTECWYVIAAEPGSFIYKGLKTGVTKQAFAEALADGSVATLLRKIPVKQGECHFIPAGTVHALGSGILVAEPQTPSDTTYRVFDWNRLDSRGKPRPLQIQEAIESIHFDMAGDAAQAATLGRLVDCEYFKVDKGHQAPGCQRLVTPGEMKVLVVMTGQGRIAHTEGQAVAFHTGDCLLVPAIYEGAMQFDRDTEYLVVTL